MGTNRSSRPSSHRVLATLLKQCRKDGGNGYVGKVIRTVGQDERITAVALADQERAYAALVSRRSEIVHYLHVDNVLIQKEIQDPVIAVGIALGGFVTIRR
jgi:hypothetical protein